MTSVCPDCAGPLDPALLAGLCPRCLLRASFRTDGERAGDYELVEELARGGTSRVFLVTHVETGSPHALKCPKPEYLATPQGRAAFRAEMQAASKLEHPHIVRARALPTPELGPCLLMELLEGGTLEDTCNRETFRDPRRAAVLMSKLARALEHAHGRGVLHCDLKPANVLFCERGEPKLADFGLVRTIDGAGKGRVAGHLGGTPGWQSPEQAAGLPVTRRSDVFNLGVMLEWLLTDELPGPRRQQGAPSCAGGPLERAVRTVATAALQLWPSDRYASAAAFADDLDRAVAGRELAGARPRPLRAAMSWVHRHVRLPLAGAGVIMCSPGVSLAARWLSDVAG